VVYDQRGKVMAEQDALGVYTTWQYDPFGNRILRVDGRNWPTTYSYDQLNRQIGRLYLDSTLATFTYDQAGQQLTMQDVSGITTRTYDDDGRIKTLICPRARWSIKTYLTL